MIKKPIAKEIIRNLPPDFQEDAVRDISLITADVFGKTHFSAIPKLFDTKFTAIFIRAYEGQYGLYRSIKEYEIFSKKIADKYLSESKYATEIAQELKNVTDELDEFSKKHTSVQDLASNHQIFFDAYDRFFAFHQATYFGGEYIVTHNKKPLPKDTQDKVDALDEAYTYNEMAVPKLETYFNKLKITSLLPEEIIQRETNKYKSSNVYRSILYLKGERYVMQPDESDELAEIIDSKHNQAVLSKTSTTGIGANKGIFKGKARVVVKLSELDKIQPGEVLVAPITRPQFNDRIRLAGAIVTDTGGILSHPSIIAREANIPCVVNTRIATKIFTTGDTVEVDANKGVVRKIV